MPVFTAGSPNSNNLEIGIAIVLKDRFSNQAREASAAIRQLHRDAKSAINANLQAANTASMVGMGAAVGMGNQIKNIVQEGANFVDTNKSQIGYFDLLALTTGMSEGNSLF